MQTAIEKAKAIRLLILDVDGTMTNGALYYTVNGAEIRSFHVQDGLGIKLLKKAGIGVAVISAKQCAAVTARLKDLQVEHIYLGHEDKLPAYTEIRQKLGLTDSQIAYMGDDLPDLPLLRRAHLAITVPKAPEIVHQEADLITQNKAGKGAVREACEFILQAQGLYQSVLQSYLA